MTTKTIDIGSVQQEAMNYLLAHGFCVAAEENGVIVVYLTAYDQMLDLSRLNGYTPDTIRPISSGKNGDADHVMQVKLRHEPRGESDGGE